MYQGRSKGSSGKGQQSGGKKSQYGTKAPRFDSANTESEKPDGRRPSRSKGFGSKPDSRKPAYGKKEYSSTYEERPSSTDGEKPAYPKKSYGSSVKKRNERPERPDNERPSYPRKDHSAKPAYGKKEYSSTYEENRPSNTRSRTKPSEPKAEIMPVIPDVQEVQMSDADKLEGRNSVMEALKANRTINKLFVAKGDREGSIRQILAQAKQKGIIVTEVDRNVLDGMSTTHAHQGVIAFVAVKDYVSVDDILGDARKKNQQPFIIILDEITDPHNLGSILRTADAVGAHGVIIPKRRAIGLTSAVSKASAGAVEYVPVARVTNISQTIDYLKRNNVWVVGTDSTGDRAFYESDMKGAVALVIGSEGEGMSRLVREKCDFVVNIPMQGQISSLNAAVAAAIVMYEVKKQKG